MINQNNDRNSQSRTAPKVEFVKANFDFKGINIYLNRPFIAKVKDALFEAGLYSPKSRECMTDESIIRLCLRAQGINPGKRTRK